MSSVLSKKKGESSLGRGVGDLISLHQRGFTLKGTEFSILDTKIEDFRSPSDFSR